MMDTNKLTTVLGGLYGIDQLQQALMKLVATPSVENVVHAVAAACVVAWAYFTNKG